VLCCFSSSHALDAPGPRFYAQAVIAAGGKFTNLNEWSPNLRRLILTAKVSGSMIRFTSTDGVLFVVCTKNGQEQRYLSKFKSVVDSQMSAGTRSGLAMFLKRTGWSLAGELVVHDLGEHGSVPLADHFVIHGGTKPNGAELTPLDLWQMKNTLAHSGVSVSGLFFPRCILLDPLDGGLLNGNLVSEALAAGSALPFWSDDASVTDRIDMMCLVLRANDVQTTSFETYDFCRLDSTTIMEGWVTWCVTDLDEWPLLAVGVDAAGRFDPELLPGLGVDCKPVTVRTLEPTPVLVVQPQTSPVLVVEQQTSPVLVVEQQASPVLVVESQASPVSPVQPQPSPVFAVEPGDVDSFTVDALAYLRKWMPVEERSSPVKTLRPTPVSTVQPQSSSVLTLEPLSLASPAKTTVAAGASSVVPGWEKLPAGVCARDLLNAEELQELEWRRMRAQRIGEYWDQNLQERLSLVMKQTVPLKAPKKIRRVDTGMKLLQNFGPSRQYTIEEALGLVAVDDVVLRPFFFGLIRFLESKYGREVKASKFNSVFVRISKNVDGVSMMTISVRSEEVWAAYDLYCQHEDVGSCRPMPLSRGMSFLLTEDRAKAMAPAAEYARRKEQRTKNKEPCYTCYTMCIRPWMQKAQQAIQNGEPVDVDSLFSDALGHMRRWHIVNPARREEFLRLVHTLAAFMAAFGRSSDTIFKVAGAPYLDIVNHMVPSAVELVTDEAYRSVMRASKREEDWQLMEASAWKDDPRCVAPSTVEELQALGPYQHLAIAISGNRSWADAVRRGLSVPNTPAGEGFSFGAIYKALRNNVLAEGLKTALLPLTKLATDYSPQMWVPMHSLRPKPLTLVFMAAIPGTGKSTCAGRLAELLGNDRAIVVSSDASKEKNLGKMLESVEIGPLVRYVIVDRCSYSSVETIRSALWGCLFGYSLTVRFLVSTSHDHCHMRLEGNDWLLPFSKEELAAYMGSVLVRKGHVGKVQGPKGFMIAAQHAVATARYSGSFEEDAKRALGPMTEEVSCGYFYPLVKDAPSPPLELSVAMLLTTGLVLSMEMRKLAAKSPSPNAAALVMERHAALVAAAKVGPKGNGVDPAVGKPKLVSDAAILRILVLGLTKEDETLTTVLEPLLEGEQDDAKYWGIWERWLVEHVAPEAEEYLQSARSPVEDVARQMLQAVLAPVSTVVDPEELVTEYLMAPVVPNTFAIMVSDKALENPKGICAKALGFAPRCGPMHITVNLPDFYSDLRGVHVLIDQALDAHLVDDLEIVSMHVSDTSAVVFMEDDSHITLICAGPNKKSCAGTRQTLAFIECSVHGYITACVPL